ncbi:MAG: chemotaxis protein CheD, partial [Solirubrobacteraceae bacterium]
MSHDPGDELIALGLGSCIALVMIDSQAQIAGLAHVMLPQSSGPTTLPGKFADTAVPELLDRMTALGATPERLRVAIAGGAQMFAGESMEIGARNTAATRLALRRAGLPC